MPGTFVPNPVPSTPDFQRISFDAAEILFIIGDPGDYGAFTCTGAELGSFAAAAAALAPTRCAKGTFQPLSGQTSCDPALPSTYVDFVVVVYDSSGGFVTGGGWIFSNQVTIKDDETLEGKATFGFVVKSRKDANVPSDNTQFQFKAGDLNFHSARCEWLVVAGNMAQLKGEGTINGEGSSKFMLSADDDSPGTFFIHIWGDTGTVYDNGSKQVLGGGSIKVHSKQAPVLQRYTN